MASSTLADRGGVRGDRHLALLVGYVDLVLKGSCDPTDAPEAALESPCERVQRPVPGWGERLFLRDQVPTAKRPLRSFYSDHPEQGRFPRCLLGDRQRHDRHYLCLKKKAFLWELVTM